MNMRQSRGVVDAHAHCGEMDQSWPQDFADYARQVTDTDIAGVALFSPVMEIYDRYDFDFVDTPGWQESRRRSNAYLLLLRSPELTVYPYFFIWNDFAVEQLSPAHCGIKWHRHADEPVYQYDAPRCVAALDEIRRRNLPVVLEEELGNTVRFIEELAKGIRVIIPHMGGLNGGFRAIADAGLWARENVWSDTALASRSEINAYIQHYGHERLMFGSDFPFGDPVAELQKVRSLGLDRGIEAAVLSENFMRLQGTF